MAKKKNKIWVCFNTEIGGFEAFSSRKKAVRWLAKYGDFPRYKWLEKNAMNHYREWMIIAIDRKRIDKPQD